MRALERRSAGILAPLFSLRSGTDWGIGEYRDLASLAAWSRRGGFSLVMTLPLLEPSPGLESPYSTGSFFALDPIYLSLDGIEEVADEGERGLTDDERRARDALRASPRVRHGAVRALKEGVLRRAHARFAESVDATSTRARALRAFSDEHADWLPEYALFRALKTRYTRGFREWPEALAERDASALAAARAQNATEIAFRTWLQWLAFEQLAHARREANGLGVALGGDEPFLVGEDSADVWQHGDLFGRDATVGAPPDAFSADGQDWGLPPYRWDRIAEGDYELFTRRGRHAAALFDLVRIDHVVGLYRTYLRPRDGGAAYFVPSEERAQEKQGERVLEALRAGGAELIAEDLGVIPDFVRASLGRLGIPGYRVLRWEQEHGRFRDPSAYPELSVATTGTHDTESSVEWWEALPEWERGAIRALPALAPVERARFGEDTWRALLETVYRSRSRLALLPIGDVLALRERVNTPSTVGPENWSWRSPWTLAALESDAIVRGRLDVTRTLARETGRARPHD